MYTSKINSTIYTDIKLFGGRLLTYSLTRFQYVAKDLTGKTADIVLPTAMQKQYREHFKELYK